MFARKLSIHLKPNTLAEFTRTFDQEVLPLLRKQKGFKEEITFAVPGASDVLAISLWDNKQNADTYDTSTYKNILKMLEKVIDGSPKVETTDVLHSTFPERVASVSAA
jgi:hypothetical protein